MIRALTSMKHPSVPPGVDETKVQEFGLTTSKQLGHATLRWKDYTGPRTFVLKERATVGSAPSSDIALNDRSVSRIHAEFVPREDGAWVRDLGSKNGTFLDGLLVWGARIPDGGKVRMGATEIVVDYSPGEEPVELWPHTSFGPLLGASPPMRRLFASLARIAANDSPVLIEGETGTGKELVAQAIHGASARASEPFVIVDCAALPEHLIESELFGHVKGAFTGADRARTGAIEAADGGTIFLDEIGELPLSLQPHLLRVLETSTIRLVGETSRKKVDVRFISATHRDLRTMVNVGAFREDLYFRLSVLPVSVPPLRERLDDLPILVQAFLPKGVFPNPETMRELMKRPWLGNVRELRNFVHRAAAFGTEEALQMSASRQAASGDEPPKSTPPSDAVLEALSASAIFAADFKTFRDEWTALGEREYLKRLLAKHDRNVAAAAREAGVDRTYIYRLMRNHSL
ncbi:MAG TPA: sigma 54-interacting transcriptional regulator [Polyangiaceae bacterium]|jgi:transcriptional regulator with GAF, ATPase, and Fis domain